MVCFTRCSSAASLKPTSNATACPSRFCPFSRTLSPAGGPAHVQDVLPGGGPASHGRKRLRDDPTGFIDLLHAGHCRRTLDSVRLEIAAWTTTGIMRSGNEDAFYMLHATEGREDDLDDAALVLLADGMGGAEAGEVAAELAVRTMRDFFMRKKTFAALVGRAAHAAFDREKCERIIAAALRRANAKVVALSVARTGQPGNVGCTAEAVFIRGRDLVVGHVGDSRVTSIKMAAFTSSRRPRWSIA